MKGPGYLASAALALCFAGCLDFEELAKDPCESKTPPAHCSQVGPVDAGSLDGGSDGGVNDAGPLDGGSTDGGPPDSGMPDGGSPDSGMPDGGPPDSGMPDGGPPDSGMPDGGPQDSGMPDGGPPDSGMPDAGAIAGGTVKWLTRFGGTEVLDQIHSIVEANGQLHFGGSFEGSIAFAGWTAYAASPDPFVAAVNATDGDPLQWVGFGSPGFSDRTVSLMHGGAGDLYVCGNYSEQLTYPGGSLNSAGDGLFIARLQSQQQLAWVASSVTLDAGATLELGGCAFSGAGAGAPRIDATGWYRDDIVLSPPDAGAFSAPGRAMFFFSRHAGDGGLLASPVSASCTGGDIRGRAVVSDGSGNSYVGGTYQGLSCPAGLPGASSEEIFVAKFDSNRNLVWFHPLGLTSWALSQELWLAVDLGGSNLWLAATVNDQGNPDLAVVRIARNNPAVTSVKISNNPGDEFARGIAVDELGDAYVLGDMTAAATFFGSPVPIRGASDAFVLRLTPSAQLRWAKSYGYTQMPLRASAIAVHPSGVTLAGTFLGTLALENLSVTSLGGKSDAFLLTVSH